MANEKYFGAILYKEADGSSKFEMYSLKDRVVFDDLVDRGLPIIKKAIWTEDGKSGSELLKIIEGGNNE